MQTADKTSHSAVESALDELNASNRKLMATIAALSERLGLVLRPEASVCAAGKAQACEAEPMRSALTCQILNAADFANSMQRDLQDVMSRLDV